MTAVEIYFQQLLNAREVSQIIISDLQGRIIMVGAPSSAADGGEEVLTEGDTNVVISGARAVTNFKGLGLGVPQFIASQFHDSMSVQFVEGASLVTLVGARSQDHCIGGLIALAQNMRTAVAPFRDMVNAVSAASAV